MAPALDQPTDWRFSKKIAYRSPVEWVLLGIFGEGSGWQRDEVYVWSLVMPLYVESTHVVLSHSRRVRGAGTFAPGTRAFAEAIASAMASLPSEGEALHRIAAGHRARHRARVLCWLPAVLIAQTRLMRCVPYVTGQPLR